jgi:hypothetical protein
MPPAKRHRRHDYLSLSSTMTSPQDILALQGPSLTPQTVTVAPSTCYNLSLFKDLLKEYRQLDDGINMRLNRTNAQFRVAETAGSTSGDACAYFWKELAGAWSIYKAPVPTDD